MEPRGVVSFRQRLSPSSDRFLNVLSPPKSDSIVSAGDELNEDEVFWNGDLTKPNCQPDYPDGVSGCQKAQNHHRQSFRQPEKFGILAALQEDNRRTKHPLLHRNPSILSSSTKASPSRLLPAIPKPPQQKEYSRSVPSQKLLQSAPVSVPVMHKKVRNGELPEVDLDDEKDDEMLPPHEIVARGSAKSPKTTFSVLEGAGRTLKGRDLRQVRNAVWRKTGFLD